MAGTSLLALLDDIATLLDDVAVMTKVAAKKSGGALVDDLALNANQVNGIHADRELPVVWVVAKGAAVNKLILVPAALAISAFASWAIAPLLIIGGAYLCFEGAEKIAHRWFRKAEDEAENQARREAVADESVDMVVFEKERIKGAIRTDFILSAEIIVIALGTVAAEPFLRQFGVLASIAVLMTIGIYGLVAGIVKIDDLGLWLLGKANAAARATGRGLLAVAPWLMKSLSVLGTAAMFLVGGAILVHNIAPVYEAMKGFVAGVGSPFGLATLLEVLAGLLAGAVLLLAVEALRKLQR